VISNVAVRSVVESPPTYTSNTESSRTLTSGDTRRRAGTEVILVIVTLTASLVGLLGLGE
jgi:hypothetical protein